MEKATLIKTLTDKFLGWSFPKDLAPDGGLSYEHGNRTEMPSGTNLMDAQQATAMFEDLLEDTEAFGLEHKLRKQIEETRERVNRTGDDESVTVEIAGCKLYTIIKPKRDV